MQMSLSHLTYSRIIYIKWIITFCVPRESSTIIYFNLPKLLLSLSTNESYLPFCSSLGDSLSIPLMLLWNLFFEELALLVAWLFILSVGFRLCNMPCLSLSRKFTLVIHESFSLLITSCLNISPSFFSWRFVFRSNMFHHLDYLVLRTWCYANFVIKSYVTLLIISNDAALE